MDRVQEKMMKLVQSREINWDMTKNRGKWKELVLATKSINGL
jgi:hypothetical protein